MNRGAAGAKALNLALQAALNPHGAPRLERFGSDVRARRQGDADRERLRQGGLQRRHRPRRVGRPRGRRRWSSTSTAATIAYEAGELDRLVLAYATTIHKAQGSEYPAVVIPLTTQHYPMLQRRLIYTAITRGSRLVVRGRTEEGARRSRSGRPPRGGAGRSSPSGWPASRAAPRRTRRRGMTAPQGRYDGSAIDPSRERIDGPRVMPADGPACYTRQVIKSYAEADDLGRDPRSGEQFPCDRSPHRIRPTPRPSRPASGRTRSTTSCSRAAPARVAEILSELEVHARRRGLKLPFTANTPYVNTITPEEQTPVPGSNEIERRIKSLVRWNAMAMVVKANLASEGIGGHISTFASSATLYEVGFNHFFKGKGHKRRRRLRLLPGPRLAGHVLARVPRRPADAAAARELPPRAEAGRRPLVVPAPVADARLLGSADGLDGPRPDHVDLPGALLALPRGSRPQAAHRSEGLGVPRRRRDRRAGVARRHLARVAREARQPDLRHQLQPAAPRRPGARQRPASSRSSKRTSAAPAGTSSRCCGAASGTSCSRATTTACCASARARSSTASTRSTR